jgi:hypothetical protein
MNFLKSCISTGPIYLSTADLLHILQSLNSYVFNDIKVVYIPSII